MKPNDFVPRAAGAGTCGAPAMNAFGLTATASARALKAASAVAVDTGVIVPPMEAPEIVKEPLEAAVSPAVVAVSV